MPDQVPERVWVSPLGVFPVEMGGSIAYVPESRALAAERERDKYFMDMVEANHEATQIAQELRALRAERDALVPLARLGLMALEGAEQGQPLTEDDFPFAAEQLRIDLAAARRVVEGA